MGSGPAKSTELRVDTATGQIVGTLPGGETRVLLPGNGPVAAVVVPGVDSLSVTLESGESVQVVLDADSGLVRRLVTMTAPFDAPTGGS